MFQGIDEAGQSKQEFNSIVIPDDLFSTRRLKLLVGFRERSRQVSIAIY